MRATRCPTRALGLLITATVACSKPSGPSTPTTAGDGASTSAAGTTGDGPAAATPGVAGTTPGGVDPSQGTPGAGATTPGDVDPGPGTDTDKATRRCAALAAAGTPPAGAASGAASTLGATPRDENPWLDTLANRIVNSDGTPFRGRGSNLPDPRGCGACACNSITLAQSTQEVMRRIDALATDWRANLVRLTLESYAQVDLGAADDPAYLAAIAQIVAHIESKPRLYVVVSVWFDPSLDSNGWPTTKTQAILTALVGALGRSPRVLFGISNEPKANTDGSLDQQVWARMNAAVQTIRDAEAAAKVPRHLVLVQGTGGWARYLDYYQTHPITAGGGDHIAYEVHAYDHAAAFADRFVGPAKVLPVIIGEFGPIDGTMTLDDTQALMVQAEAAGVPYIAWTFHGRCVPSLLDDTSGGGCGLNMPLNPSPWGQQLKAQLAKPW